MSDGMLMQGDQILSAGQGGKKEAIATATPDTLVESSAVWRHLAQVLVVDRIRLQQQFHSSIAMSPFKVLYGKPCRTLLCWSEVGERVLVGPEIVDETTQNIQIIERVGEVAYQLDLPPELSRVHNVFHVSMLRRYVANLSPVIPPQSLEINPNLTYDKVPMTILDWKDKVLKNKTIRMVKVLWRNHSVEEATWETDERMRDLYPHLFFD
ncbi:uncharacterized protein [Malus domestica]|uniref:uncharacterized protein n=1 Tax=Malus domestica TaxID=3750 RepID=UPI003975528E